ncbi:MAG TPA: DUF1573 domain-containing protein [Sediminibacterium sp.]|nr:DUF1573 domain-containing protein [Sediminibacterium sp.]
MSRLVRWTSALLIICWVLSCQQNALQDDAGLPYLRDSSSYTEVHWIDSIVSFGEVVQGKQLHIPFRYRNTGSKPLYLSNVRAACGCTVPEYTQGAVAPGDTGVVIAAFDTRLAATGNVRKIMSVFTNTRGNRRHTLIFTGQIREAVDR